MAQRDSDRRFSNKDRSREHRSPDPAWRKKKPQPRGRDRGPREPLDIVILYGWHPVTLALTNPKRKIRRLYATENALRRLAEEGIVSPVAAELVRPDAIASRLGPDAVHQGLLAEVDHLPVRSLADIEPDGIVLVLDQITDPHNVGAILRSAAAFGVKAIVTTQRHSPEATGVLAKAASGAWGDCAGCGAKGPWPRLSGARLRSMRQTTKPAKRSARPTASGINATVP